MKRILSAIALACMIPASPALAQNWNAEIVDTGQGYLIGNPEAPLQLVEFISYTCPHCAHFEADSEAELRYHYVHEGFAAVEVRHLIRNPIDLAAALLTECGDPSRFFDNHKAVLSTQEDWLARAQGLTEAQMARWQAGTVPSRMRAIASDLELDDLMEGRGYSASEISACLGNEAHAREIADKSQANAAEYNVPGTPSFVLNGELLDGVYGWEPLREVLVSARQDSE
ncbi:thioredoxin domain-containing protein [Aurantiacibacter rhizosphaerae]|uniref:Thioredoxin domain-containing protein n=1 Tax=Aurantiacibacter rhizosphaerae TaxID=2691582 RepID=A0A844XG43_9SPHN|nr:thioredoxin domain-containing protein [Aurantiacibacter rhizosphaerae]MWV28495.1 thioredoxin domain-containing protein [Aurantiacibacter rhizosphaerae]